MRPGLLILWAVAVGPVAAGPPSGLASEFFALDTAMVKNLRTDAVQEADIAAAAALGYKGIAVVVPDAAAWGRLTEKILPWLDARKLKLYAVYSVVRVDRTGAAADPLLKENLRFPRRRGTVIWLPITGVGMPPSDPAAAERAVLAVREAADWARDTVSRCPSTRTRAMSSNG